LSTIAYGIVAGYSDAEFLALHCCLLNRSQDSDGVFFPDAAREQNLHLPLKPPAPRPTPTAKVGKTSMLKGFETG
jgi:hypothetical protein